MKKIACLGNITYDTFAYTENFPVENSRTDYSKLDTSPGGPAFNAASVLDKFGDAVYFYGFIGDDPYSKLLKMDINETGINCEHLVQRESFAMPSSYIIVCSNNKTRTINAYRDPKDNSKALFCSYGNDYDYILTDGKYPEAFKELKQNNPEAKTIIDAGRCKDEIVEIAKDIDYIVASEDFANDLMDKNGLNYHVDMNDKDQTLAVLTFLKKYFKKSTIAVTVGKYGYLFFDDQGNLVNKEAYDFDKVLDTTAAGDIFHGAFTHALANDFDFEDALDIANITSSLSVTRYGGRNSIPELNEVMSIKDNSNKELLNKKGV